VIPVIARISCSHCSKAYKNKKSLQHHIRQKHCSPSNEAPDTTAVVPNNAKRRRRSKKHKQDKGDEQIPAHSTNNASNTVCLTGGIVDQVSHTTEENMREQRQSVDPEVQVVHAEQPEHRRDHEEGEGDTDEHNSSADDQYERQEQDEEENCVPDSSDHVVSQTSLMLSSDDNHHRRCETTPTQTTTRENPVNKLSLFNLTMKDFEGCRITPDSRISVHDAIAKFCSCTKTDAKKKFHHLSELKDTERVRLTGPLTKYKFPGQGYQITPVCTFSQLLGILSCLPGKNAKLLRREQAEVASRSVAGDRDMEDAVRGQRQNVEPEMQAMAMGDLPRSDTAVIADNTSDELVSQGMFINGVSYPLPNESLYGKRIASALEEAICAAADKQRAVIRTEHDKITRDNEMANLRQIAEVSRTMLDWCDDAQMGLPPQVTSVIRARAQNIVLEKLQTLNQVGKHALSNTLIPTSAQPIADHANGSDQGSRISPVVPA
jgi:hypothetical protein